MGKTLYLNLKKHWFDMILSGEKKEEYREIKIYWLSRFLYRIPVHKGGYWSALSDFEKGDYSGKSWKEFTGGAPIFNGYEKIIFRNGYQKNARQLTIECLGIEIGNPNQKWGGKIMPKECFIIKLGNIIP